MKILNECWALIPARSGSKTIKNKNIKKIDNKPLIYYSLNFAKNIKFFDKIIFSSDSNKYLKMASKYGKFYLHKRNKFSSSDSATDYDIFRNFLADHRKVSDVLPKYFAHLRPTTPVRSKQTVVKALKNFKKNSKKYSSLRSISLMSETSFKSLRIVNKKLCSIINKDYDMDLYNNPQGFFPKTYVANGIIDIYLTKNIIKGYLLGKKVYPFVVKDLNSDIDSLQDFKFVEYNIKKRKLS
tara:strand:- start:2530 stop:3249 length:720 start_codon:yes stop_codon:yes gene_type:complete